MHGSWAPRGHPTRGAGRQVAAHRDVGDAPIQLPMLESILQLLTPIGSTTLRRQIEHRPQRRDIGCVARVLVRIGDFLAHFAGPEQAQGIGCTSEHDQRRYSLPSGKHAQFVTCRGNSISSASNASRAESYSVQAPGIRVCRTERQFAALHQGGISRLCSPSRRRRP